MSRWWGIRHARWLWHAWHLSRWAEMWERHGYFVNERDVQHLERIWKGEA